MVWVRVSTLLLVPLSRAPTGFATSVLECPAESEWDDDPAVLLQTQYTLTSRSKSLQTEAAIGFVLPTTPPPSTAMPLMPKTFPKVNSKSAPAINQSSVTEDAIAQFGPAPAPEKDMGPPVTEVVTNVWPYFVLISSLLVVTIVATLVVVSAHVYRMEQVQAIRIEIFIIFSIMLVCPACRLVVPQHGLPLYAILFVRMSLDAMLLCTCFGALPSIFVHFKARCMETRAKRAERQSAKHASEARQAASDAGSDPLKRGYADRLQALANNQDELRAAREDFDEAKRADCYWRAGQGGEAGVITKTWRLLAALLWLRPTIQAIRIPCVFLFGFETATTKLVICAVNTAILVVACSIAGLRLHPLIKKLPICGVSPPVFGTCVVCSVVCTIAGVQDFIFFLLYNNYGIESLGYLLAGVLFFHELVGGIGIMAAMTLSHPWLGIVRSHLGCEVAIEGLEPNHAWKTRRQEDHKIDEVSGKLHRWEIARRNTTKAAGFDEMPSELQAAERTTQDLRKKHEAEDQEAGRAAFARFLAKKGNPSATPGPPSELQEMKLKLQCVKMQMWCKYLLSIIGGARWMRPACESTDEVMKLKVKAPFVADTREVVFDFAHADDDLQKSKKLKRLSTWHGVFADLYSMRQRSQILAALVAAIVMVDGLPLYQSMTQAIATWQLGNFASLASSVAVILLAFVLWLIASIALAGNNIYANKWWLVTCFVYAVYIIEKHAVIFYSVHSAFYVTDQMWIWRDFFEIMMGIVVLLLAVVALMRPEHDSFFHKITIKAGKYTAKMMEPPPMIASLKAKGKQFSSFAKMTYCMSTSFPPVLLVGAIATTPVALAISYFVVLLGEEAFSSVHAAASLQAAIVAQASSMDGLAAVMGGGLPSPPIGVPSGTSVNVSVLPEGWNASFGDMFNASGSPVQSGKQPQPTLSSHKAAASFLSSADRLATGHEGSMGSVGASVRVWSMAAQRVLTELDRDQDGRVSLEEARLEEAYALLGTPDLVVPVRRAWRLVDGGKRGSLGHEELTSLISRARAQRAFHDAWLAPDPADGAQILLGSLDLDRDGRLSRADLPDRDVAETIGVLVPEVASALRQRIPGLWSDAGGDRGGLGAVELARWLAGGRRDAAAFRRCLIDAVGALARIAALEAGAAEGRGQKGVSTQAAKADAITAFARAAGTVAVAQLAAEVLLPRLPVAWHSGVQPEELVRLLSPQLRKAGMSAGVGLAVLLAAAARGARPAAESLLAQQNGQVDWRSLDLGPALALLSPQLALEVPSWLRAPLSDAKEIAASLDALLHLLHAHFGDVDLDGVAGPGDLVLLARWAAEDAADGGLRTPLPHPANHGRYTVALVDVRGRRSQQSPGIVPVPSGMWTAMELPNAKPMIAQNLAEKAFLGPHLAHTLDMGLNGTLNGTGLAAEMSEAFPDQLKTVAACLNVSTAPSATEAEVAVAIGTAYSTSASVQAKFQEMSPPGGGLPPCLVPLNAPDLQTLLAPQSFSAAWQSVGFRDAVLDAMKDVGLGDFTTEVALQLPPIKLTAGMIALLLGVSIVKLRCILYVSVTAAMIFALFVIAQPFIGHVRTYEQMQRGDHSYPGGSKYNRNQMRGKYGVSGYFPGTFFATILTGMVVVFFLLFLVLVVVSQPLFWSTVWSFHDMIIGLGILLFVQILVLRRIIMCWYCVTDGYVTAPRVFSAVWYVFLVVNFVLGLLASVIRFACMFPFMFIQFHCLDQCVLPESLLSFDVGYNSWLTTLRVGYERTNPIKQTFLAEVNPKIHDMYGEAPDLVLRKSAEEYGVLAYRPRHEDPDRPAIRRVRNRWHLAMLLYRRPELAQYRVRDD